MLNQKRMDRSDGLSCSCLRKNLSGSRSPFLFCIPSVMDRKKRSDAASFSGLTPYLLFETNPSGLSCPLSRYRPGLQIFCSVNKKIRPADRQRLLSAYPAGYPALLIKDWLPPPFTVLPAIIISCKNNSRARQPAVISNFCYSDQRFVLYGPFGLSLEAGLFRPPGKEKLLR